MCLGARLAKLELLNILAETLDQYDRVEFTNANQTIGVANAFLNRPDPIPDIKFTRAV
jgi:cytochrome P450